MMISLLDALAMLLVLLALFVALKRLLPHGVWARVRGRDPVAEKSGCGGACSGCSDKAPRKS